MLRGRLLALMISRCEGGEREGQLRRERKQTVIIPSPSAGRHQALIIPSLPRGLYQALSILSPPRGRFRALIIRLSNQY